MLGRRKFNAYLRKFLVKPLIQIKQESCDWLINDSTPFLPLQFYS